jgi:predicted nucleic acid-binding protein
MTALVILDTDFLSAFLKIQRCELILRLYQVDRLQLAPAAYRELAQTSLLFRLTDLAWITLTTPLPEELTKLRESEQFSRLGAGEQESIALALSRKDAVLLSNDNQARTFAVSCGIAVANIPAFLLACKMAGELTVEDIQQIIQDLWQYDHYKFRQDVQGLLLS